MIFGIGVDLIEVDRIRAADARHGERFARRILGAREFERFQARRARSEQRGIVFLATRFAAKEAISKALGLGMRSPMTWRAVEIINDATGRPIAFMAGAELRRYVEHRRLKLHVSLSDERLFAVAYAIAESEAGH
jgi:holo-[acyl-carrier protein] synthase